MALARWQALCMDATDPSAVAPFWADVLGLRLTYQDSADAVLSGPTKEHGVWIDTVPEPKTVKNRVHLDLRIDSYAPLIHAGGAVLEEHQMRYDWTVLADPAGNEFCAFPPRNDPPTALVVDAQDAVRMAAWWADVLGARTAEAPDGTLRWVRAIDAFPWDVWKFLAVPEPKTVKNRWHWDVTCDDVEALLSRGATLLRRPGDDVSWHVLADPEGNEFCVFASA